MSSYAYEEIAVDGVATWLADATYGIEAQLRAIEVERTLDANTLPDPEAIEQAYLPTDARSPLVQVYEEASESTDHRARLALVDLTVAVTFNSDSDLPAAELLLRRYLEAIRRCLAADSTCGGTVGQAVWTDANRSYPLTYDSVTRHARAIGVLVRVQD